MEKQTLSEQMRETVNLLNEFKGDTPCRFDPDSNMILFTVEDLEAFAVNWKFRVDRHDHLGPILGDAAMLVIATDHEARNVLQEQNGDPVLIA